MNNPDNRDRTTPGQSLVSSVSFLLFGLTLLAFLVAIDRPHWFHLKPATGTARAMSLAAGVSPDK